MPVGHVPVSLVAAGINCTESTCVSADRVTVAIEYFLLGATKGFVQDLVAADMSQVVQVLVASGVMASSLDDLDQISTQLLQCSIASGGSETLLILEEPYSRERFNEFRANELFNFINFHWINDDGRVGQNRQFVPHGVGFLVTTSPKLQHDLTGCEISGCFLK